MYEPAFSRRCRRLLFSGAISIGLASVALPCPAQVFAVGGGGTLSNDGISTAGPSSFSKGGYFGFLEMHLEMDTAIQLRGGKFRLPGKLSGSPDLTVTEASLTISYLFKENWFDVGFYGGGGIFRVVPDDPTALQSPADVRENVWGLKGGVLTVVPLGGKLDLRLEGGITYLAATYTHAPIVLGAGLSYRF
jgi:hypothetical protein